jgi:hypothetical protein
MSLGRRDWTRQVEWIARWGPLILLGALTAIVAVTYLPVFRGEPCGDDNTFHFAELAHLARAFASGDLDLWNPAGNSGFASGYYYQVIPQAVPAALSALTGLSPLTCFQLGIFVPLVLAPAAAYRALRVGGASSWVALGAAVAIPYAIGSSKWGHGADGTFVVGLYTQLWAFVALPLAIAHGARWIDEGRGVAPAIAWGLFVGLCHPFAGIALGVALLAGTPWAWFVAWRERHDSWHVPWRLGELGVLLLLGSACAWLPVLVDYDGFGGFPHRVADEIGPGFATLATWLRTGSVLDQGRLPVLTALLPIVAIFARAPWLPRWWAAALAYGLLLGLGPHLGKAGDDDLLPAVRFYGGLQIALAVIAGAGAMAVVERVWRVKLGEPWRPMAQAGAATVAAICAVFVVGLGIPTQRARVKIAHDFPAIHRTELDEMFRAMRTARPGRLQVRAGAENHWAILLPYVHADRPASLVMGGAALQSSPSYVYQWELRDRDPARTAWVFDAPLVLIKSARSGELAGGVVLARNDAYELRELPAPGLVGPVRVMGALPAGRAAARKAAVRWLWSEQPFENRVLAHHGHGDAGPAPSGQTLAVRRGPSTISADVIAEGTTTFVIRESWHPRWTARIDGAAAPIRRVTPDYMAIDVPAGTHTIDLAFERPRWTWLLWFLCPWLIGAGWAGETILRRRREAAATATPPPAATAS